jgi:hypothetical protein
MPQHALDEFLLGWLKAERGIMAAPLSPRASEAFNRLLEAEAWRARRGGQMGDSTAPFEIGYRLDLPDGMVEPPGKDLKFRLEGPYPERLSGPVEFFAAGKSCGRTVVHFVNTEGDGDRCRYLIDNTDMNSLVEALRRCPRE